MRPRVRIQRRHDSPFLSMVYRDPLTGRRVVKSAKTNRRREAERLAAKWEVELAGNLAPHEIHWSVFRHRFATEHLVGLRETSRTNYFHALNRFESIIGTPTSIAAINASTLSTFQAKLRAHNLSPETIRHHVRHVRSALGWAAKIGLIHSAPKTVLPPRGGSRGRPLTWLEAARYLSALHRGCPDHHWHAMSLLVKSLWLGGLRLNEALAARFDGGPVHIDLNRDYPCIHWQAAGQKSRRAETVPLTPDFAKLLRRVPRTGKLFDSKLSRRQVAKYLTAAGSLSGIVVWTRGKKVKFASAHDFRRSFGHRWALRVHPIVLKTLMRHDSLDTTLRYYVDIDSNAVAAQIWGSISGATRTAHVATSVASPVPEKPAAEK